MNCYNSDTYLKEAVDSVINQTYQNWEIIFWDNHSTDDSAKIIKSYNDKRIKYLYAINHTPLGEARNFALSKASGEYIAFLDCDDIWMKDKLQLQVAIMKKNLDFEMCYSGVVHIDKHGKELRRVLPKAKSGNVFAQLLEHYDVNIQSILIKNSNKVKFNSKLKYSPDYYLFLKVASEFKIYVQKSFLVKYRVHSESLSLKSKGVQGIEAELALDNVFLNKDTLKIKYAQECNLAYAQAHYARALYLMKIGRYKKSRRILAKSKTVNIKYFILFLVSCLPHFVWKLIHFNRN
jgi:glycosyltransferase involved in cell wall biosynthesis